jgi:hypothetical protein
MDGMPVHNKQQTTCPLKVALANGRRVMSTHMCDIIIPGLLTTLIGHIIPKSSIASLFGIHVLTEAGCMVKFDNKKCVVRYNGKIILIGMKNLTTDLWALPIVGPAAKTSLNNTHEVQDPFVNLREEFLEATSKASSSKESTLAIPVCASTQACEAGGKAMKSLKKKPPPNKLGLFTHTVRTKANSIKFAHQSLCSSCISTLLKAIQHSFLKGCPNLTTKGVMQYLNPSAATAKGHMKRPHQGIRSTMQRQPRAPPSKRQLPNVQASPINESKVDDVLEPLINVGPIEHGPNVIVKDNDSSVGFFFVLAHLQISKQEFCTMILPGRSHTCPLRGMYAS